MPTSNSLLISDALGLLGVLQETEVMTAEQGAHGLRTLNQVMADWEQDGVDLQYFEQVALPDETPLPDHAIMAAKYYLAIALAPFYAARVPPEFLTLADKYYSRLTRDSISQQLRVSSLRHLPHGRGWESDYDIERGY
jgi:hypothetical protein